MGCGVKEKSLRQARKHRHSSSTKPPTPDPLTGKHTPADPSPNPNPSISFDDAGGWGYCTEDQLEELLLKNLDFVYKEALTRLISTGYDETQALRAILTAGHCYGSMDVLSNILHNTITHLNSGDPSSVAPFTDLRHLQEYSLAGLVCLLQQVRPHLTRGDALWCLLLSELHVGRATAIEIPSAAASASASAGPVPRDLHDPKWRGPIPVRVRSNGGFSFPNPERKEKGSAAAVEADVVAAVLKSLESMSIEDEKPEDQLMKEKKERGLSMIQKIQDLEGQVKERKEWAQQKAMEAAKKLSNDLTELKVLRMEKEENQRVKKGKQALEDTTMKMMSEMEAALKKASGQVDRANAVVARLKADNAEIRAEMEASKLSVSESVNTCLEVAKREKRCLKRLLAWEKQREKLQEENAEERKKIEELEQQLSEVREAQKQAEERDKRTGLLLWLLLESINLAMKKKQQRIEALVRSQVGSICKFFSSTRTTQSSVGNLDNEEHGQLMNENEDNEEQIEPMNESGDEESNPLMRESGDGEPNTHVNESGDEEPNTHVNESRDEQSVDEEDNKDVLKEDKEQYVDEEGSEDVQNEDSSE